MRALLVAALLCAGAGAAQAQSGASGGGSFFDSGGGGGGGGGGGSYSSSWDSGGSGSSYSSSGSSSGGGGEDGPGAFIVLGFFVGGMFWWGVKDARRRREGGGGAPRAKRLDVSVLRLALDARARTYMQAELARIMKHSDTRGPAGLAVMLRDVANLLRQHHRSWAYAAVVNHDPMDPASAEAAFHRHAGEARATYKDELLRATAGTVTTAAGPEYRARPEEGPGLVVVTLVVCARGKLVDFHDPTEPEEIRRWLEAMAQLHGGNLVALEVVWTPAAENDRLSSVELEHHFPSLKKLLGCDPFIGRTLCESCSGIFPAELRACPHCGARVKDAA
jgi:uncharacterized membrane protein